MAYKSGLLCLNVKLLNVPVLLKVHIYSLCFIINLFKCKPVVYMGLGQIQTKYYSSDWFRAGSDTSAHCLLFLQTCHAFVMCRARVRFGQNDLMAVSFRLDSFTVLWEADQIWTK